MRVWAILAVLGVCLTAAEADELVLFNGRRYKGRLIERTPTAVTFEALVGSSTMTLTLATNKVDQVIVDGKVPLPAPKPQPRPRPKPQPVPQPKPEPAEPSARPSPRVTSPTRIEELIQQAGRTPPDWWDSVALKHPPELDMTWKKPNGPWNPNKWIGQYFWSVINPNPGRWKEGVRLLHHVLTVNKDNPTGLRTAMMELGRTYSRYLGDWPRAAFWYRKAGDATDSRVAAGLAECYWRMGSKSMAAAALSRSRAISIEIVRVWSEMGEYTKALNLADAVTRRYPYDGNILAGDIYRVTGRYPQALACYRKILDMPFDKRMERYRARAQANTEGIRLFEALDLKQAADGTYSAASIGFRGDVTVAVTVADGKIAAVKITSHKEDGYFYHQCDPVVLDKIVAKQGFKGIDAVTGATVTSEAILNAAAKALSKAIQ